MVEFKKKRRKKRAPRYLIRQADGDFGPYTINEVRNAIEAREVNLGTEIQEVGGESWQPAGVFSECAPALLHCSKQDVPVCRDRRVGEPKRSPSVVYRSENDGRVFPGIFPGVL